MPATNTPTSASHTVMSSGVKPTWWYAMLPVSGPASSVAAPW